MVGADWGHFAHLWEGAAWGSCPAHPWEKAGQWALWGAWTAQQEVEVLLAVASLGMAPAQWELRPQVCLQVAQD